MNVKAKSDTYLNDRKHLENLSDQEIYDLFWKLTGDIIDPLLELSKTNTTPSVERSVLLRMGFSSIEAAALVEKIIDYNLMPKGAGHVVYALSKVKNISVRDAGLKLINDECFEDVISYFNNKEVK